MPNITTNYAISYTNKKNKVCNKNDLLAVWNQLHGWYTLTPIQTLFTYRTSKTRQLNTNLMNCSFDS